MNSRTPAAAALGRAGVQGAEPLGINTLEYQSTVKNQMSKYMYQIVSFSLFAFWMMDSRGVEGLRVHAVPMSNAEHQREAGADVNATR